MRAVRNMTEMIATLLDGHVSWLEWKGLAALMSSGGMSFSSLSVPDRRCLRSSSWRALSSASLELSLICEWDVLGEFDMVVAIARRTQV